MYFEKKIIRNFHDFGLENRVNPKFTRVIAAKIMKLTFQDTKNTSIR